MKIVVTDDDEKTTVYQNVSDLFIAVRYEYPMATPAKKPVIHTLTASHSWGSNIRELVKEVTQALSELQDFLREQRNGGSS